MSKLQYILSHFTGAKPSAGEGQHIADCPCPHHKKQNNKHLAIKETAQGDILLHCFAGCFTDEILNEVGLKLKDLFPDQTKEEKYAHRIKEGEKRKTVIADKVAMDLWMDLTVLRQILGGRIWGGDKKPTCPNDQWDREKQAMRMLPKLIAEYYGF